MKKLLSSFFFLILALVPAVFAQASDHAVIMHFDQPIEVPGHVLQPGTYQFVAPESPAGIMYVYDAHRTKLYATIQTMPMSRLDATGDFNIKLADDNGQHALMGWFAPGETSGYELLYPRQEMKQLSAAEKSVPVGNLGISAANGD